MRDMKCLYMYFSLKLIVLPGCSIRFLKKVKNKETFQNNKQIYFRVMKEHVQDMCEPSSTHVIARGCILIYIYIYIYYLYDVYDIYINRYRSV